MCLDPSKLLDSRLSRAHASVLFSATLTPADYFVDILGGGRGAARISLPSPFSGKQFCLAAVPSVSTRYEDREKSLRKIVACIAATVSARIGNYIVYFPSYSYMNRIREAFSQKYPSVPLIVQEEGMSPRRRESFLSQFADDDRQLRVGFCVLGGSFSEGVDLLGRRLIGTIIVGVGLPGLSNERNILKEYFDGRCERGYDYAYTYPGMNRVLQAAGRVIRREEDEGVVVLIDDRYATPQYQMLFPASWMHLKYAGNATSLAELVKNFWKNRKNSTKK
jgi:Rad3-related DNA helicase